MGFSTYYVWITKNIIYYINQIQIKKKFNLILMVDDMVYTQCELFINETWLEHSMTHHVLKLHQSNIIMPHRHMFSVWFVVCKRFTNYQSYLISGKRCCMYYETMKLVLITDGTLRCNIKCNYVHWCLIIIIQFDFVHLFTVIP